MRRNLWRRTAIAILLCVVGLSTQGCQLGSHTNDTDDMPVSTVQAVAPVASTSVGQARTTITFAAWDSFRPLYEPLIADFEAQNPTVHVQYVALDSVIGPNRSTQLTWQQESATIARLADAALVQLPSYRLAYAARNGIFANLQQLVDADARFNRDDFYPGALELATTTNQLYLLPRTTNVQLLTYNRDLWQRYRLPEPQPDWTWHDLRSALQLLGERATDAPQRYGYVDFWGSDAVTAELRDAGVATNATVPLDDPRLQSALQRAATLVQQRAVYLPPLGDDGYPNWQNLDWRAVKQEFVVWPFKLAFDIDFKAGFLPNVLAPTRGSLEGYVISGGSQHTEVAYEWLAFLSQNEPPRTATFDAGAIPARKSYAQRMGYWDRLLPDQATAIHATLTYPAATMTEAVGDAAAVAYDRQLYLALNRVIRQQQSVAQAAREAQERFADSARVTVAPDTPAAPITVATPLPDTAQTGATPITFANTTLPESWLRTQIAAFQQQHPGVAVRLTTTANPFDLWTTANAVDCLAWFRPPDASETQRLLDLKPLINADATFAQSDYPAVLTNDVATSDRQYGLPYRVSIAALHTNPALLQAASASTTWQLADMQQAAVQSTGGNGPDRRYGFALTGDVPALTLWYLRATGVHLTETADGAPVPTYTEPGVAMSARSFVDLLRTTSPHTRLPGYTAQQQTNEATAAIAAGRVAIWLDTQPRNLASTSQDTIASLPAQRAASPFNVVTTLAITRHSTHAALCWSWLTFLSNQSPPLDGTFPARRSLITLHNRQGFSPEAIGIYTATVAQPSDTRTPFPSAIDPYWLLRAIDRALQGGNLERELTDAQTTTEAYLACVAGGGAGPTCAVQVDPAYAGLQRAGP